MRPVRRCASILTLRQWSSVARAQGRRGAPSLKSANAQDLGLRAHRWANKLRRQACSEVSSSIRACSWPRTAVEVRRVLMAWIGLSQHVHRLRKRARALPSLAAEDGGRSAEVAKHLCEVYTQSIPAKCAAVRVLAANDARARSTSCIERKSLGADAVTTRRTGIGIVNADAVPLLVAAVMILCTDVSGAE